MAGQRARKHKVSGGTGAGSRKVRLSALDKVLLGRGMIDSMRYHREQEASERKKK